MADIVVPNGFGKVSSAFATLPPADSLGSGISSGMAVVGYRGKVWSTRFGGVETPLMRDDGDGPRSSIEVVLVKASPFVAKNFYAGGYVDGSNAAPDCASANGITPDAGVPHKQHDNCKLCPQNVWGAKVTEAGKPARACADNKRMAIVPLADIDNEVMGGPMLLRVPAASLKDLKLYGDRLEAMGYPYQAVATRIAFDHEQAYPKFVFTAIRALDDAEAAKIVDLVKDVRTDRILNASEATSAPPPAAPPAPKPETFFEQPPAATPPKPTPPAPAAVAAPLPPHDPVTGEVTEDEDERLIRLAQERLAAKKKAAEAKADTPVANGAAPPASLSPEKFNKVLDSLV